jgi:hypothetical protein
MKPLEHLFAFGVSKRQVPEIDEKGRLAGPDLQHSLSEFLCPYSGQTPRERHRERFAFRFERNSQHAFDSARRAPRRHNM